MKQKKSVPLLVIASIIIVLSGCGKREAAPDSPPDRATGTSPATVPQASSPVSSATALQQLVARNLQHELKLQVERPDIANRWQAIRSECLKLGCLLDEARYEQFSDDDHGIAIVNAHLPREQVEPYLAFVHKQGVVLSEQSTQLSRRDEMAAVKNSLQEAAQTAQDASASKSDSMAAVAKMQTEQAALATALSNTPPVNITLTPPALSVWEHSLMLMQGSFGGLVVFISTLLPFVVFGAAIYGIYRALKKRGSSGGENQKQ